MRQDKERIVQMRKEGRTYREIQRDTGVSRATLSSWFRNEVWSKHLSDEHIKSNRGASKDRMERMNIVRRLKLQYEYALMEAEAQKEYETYKKDPLFWAGLMVYQGAGDKGSEGQVRVSSGESFAHMVFAQFAGRYLGFSLGQFRYSLVLYSENDALGRVAEWADKLGVPVEHIYAPQVVEAKKGSKRLRYGTCISIISNTARKKKLLKWLTLAQSERFDAGMVQG